MSTRSSAESGAARPDALGPHSAGPVGGGPVGGGPVVPSAQVRRTPLPLRAVRLTDGFLARLQRANGTRSIPRGADHLERQGAWLNFDDVAEGSDSDRYFGPCFEDGEAYKWLEAVAWEAGREHDPRLADWLASSTRRIAAAQAPDGYLATYVQRGRSPARYAKLAWDHEIFDNGALIQSAVARYRTTGLRDLLDVAVRAADHLVATFGPGGLQGTCGHPLIEMALVELYRTTGDRRHLDLASYFVDVRGHDLIDPAHAFGAAYHSDRVPVRQTTVPEGHAVRAIYLAAGATDVAIETGDAELLDQLELQWRNMVEQKMYVTGGLGSRWEGEAFGDPYELPSDRAYAETCAAIAGLQWNWRLLLATGEARYADLLERQLYNAVLPGVSLDGDAYFYANALQVRAGSVATDARMAVGGRQPWFGCSCCPTNLMRTIASLQHYVATSSGDALAIHQFGAGTIDADLPAGAVRLRLETDYPWHGRLRFTVERSPGSWALEVRIPDWATGASARIGDRRVAAEPGGYLRVERDWAPDDRLTVELPMHPRFTPGRHRVDATRGCVAIERGPLVYAVEQVDQPADCPVDDLVVDPGVLDEVRVPELFGGTPVAVTRDPVSGAEVRAIPYFMWANRQIGPMRIWLPARPHPSSPSSWG